MIRNLISPVLWRYRSIVAAMSKNDEQEIAMWDTVNATRKYECQSVMKSTDSK